LAAMLRDPLEWFATVGSSAASDRRVKVVVILDQAQELQAFGHAALSLLLSLPQALNHGNQFAILAVGRLPLSGMGIPDVYPSVPFPAYTKAEISAILSREFTRTVVEEGREDISLPDDVDHLCSGVLSFALPSFGSDLRHLLPIGEEVLRRHAPLGQLCMNMQHLLSEISSSVQERKNIPHVSGFTPGQDRNCSDSKGDDDITFLAMDAARKRMTKTEKRLLVAAYVASRVDKKDDGQLFGTSVRRRRGARRKPAAEDEDSPLTRSPEPVPVTRLMAVYHALAGQPQLMGPYIFEHLVKMRHSNLIRFAGDRYGQMKIICRVERQLACACAGELDIDMAEYLCTA